MCQYGIKFLILLSAFSHIYADSDFYYQNAARINENCRIEIVESLVFELLNNLPTSTQIEIFNEKMEELDKLNIEMEKIYLKKPLNVQKVLSVNRKITDTYQKADNKEYNYYKHNTALIDKFKEHFTKLIKTFFIYFLIFNHFLLNC